MQQLHFNEIAQIVNGKIFAACNNNLPVVDSVITDSRLVHAPANALFVALKGPVYNGHHFISELNAKGVNAFLVDEKEAITPEAAFILVDDTRTALQKLAAAIRKSFTGPVVGITGSNGKTIVKEWLNELLAADRKIVRSPKSFNSQIGVPLSVLLMNNSYNLAIIEAGISQPGEMEKLEPVIHPEIGILTNIGDAHQEFFDSTTQKLYEKLALFKHSKTLIARMDDALIYSKVKPFCANHNIEALFWSTENTSCPIFFTVEKRENSCLIHARIHQNNFTFSIPFTDESAIENACHCFVALHALKGQTPPILKRFGQLQQLAMRLEIKRGINQNILINDYYNSDLNSLSIALSVLQQQAANKGQKKVLILSDIQQTGLPASALYTKVNQLIKTWGIDQLIGIGPAISANRKQFSVAAGFFSNSNDFVQRFPYQSIHSAAILIKGARQFRFEKISGLLQQKAHQTVLEINLNAIVNNLNTFRARLHKHTKIVVMVKAFSYGSGDVEIARLLQHQNVDYLAVAVADEGMQLRNAGISLPIIVMNPERDSFQNMITHRLEPNIYDTALLRSFAQNAAEFGVSHFPIHLKIDTGMNRLGLKTQNELQECLLIIRQSETVKVSSVFSHLAGSDDPALDSFTQEQFATFDKATAFIAQKLPYSFDRHILNSAGIERFPEKQYEMVRLGIGLYGISPSGLALENISTLKSTISQIKYLQANESVGYGRRGTVSAASKIAVVPIGYADGIHRKLGNHNGSAFVHGKKAPIIGNICMDMLMLDVSGIDAHAGDKVEFFGPHIPIEEIAQQLDTIPYEVLTGISQRVKRIYLRE